MPEVELIRNIDELNNPEPGLDCVGFKPNLR